MTCRSRTVLASGFTLVEVLVALAVVAIALGAGMKAAGALTDNAQRLGDVTAAQWCADNQITQLRLSKVYPGTSDSDFSCEQLGRTYSGKLVARAHPANANYSKVEAVISDEQGHVLLRLATLMGRF